MKKLYLLAVLITLAIALTLGGWYFWMLFIMAVFIGPATIPHHSGGPQDTWMTR